MATKHSNIQTLKNSNLNLIFTVLRKENKSRIEISKESGLTRSAVTMITNQLIEKGILKEIGTVDSKKGRRPVLLSIVKDFKYAIGINLERKKVSIVLSDLANTILFCEEEKIQSFSSYEQVLSWIITTIGNLLDQSKICFTKLIGIGISCPGPVDYKTGSILTPPNFSLFHNKAITTDIQRHYKLPIFIENNAVSLAITDYFKSKKPTDINSMLITFSDGIGSCIIKNGAIYRGFAGFAGEIGHTSIDPFGMPCTCGNTGCLELYITLSALKEKFGFETYEEVVDRAYAKDEKALEILEYLARILSFSLINVINVLDLNEILLHGEFNYKPTLLISLIQSYISNNCILAKTHPITISTSHLDLNDQKSASVTVVLNEFFKQNI